MCNDCTCDFGCIITLFACPILWRHDVCSKFLPYKNRCNVVLEFSSRSFEFSFKFCLGNIGC